LNVRPTSTPSGGWIGPGSAISVLEDEYRRAAGKPRLLYVKEPAEVSDGPLETLAQLEHADGEDERAVELLSAANSLRARLHTPLWPPALARHERLLEELRERLGEEAFAASRERGAAIDPGELQEMARALNRAAGERPEDDR
jgi:hypothetical protein